MINKSLFFCIIAAVVFVSMISLPATVVIAQQTTTTQDQTINNTQAASYLFGCKDGIVIFENNASLKMGCVNAPFQFHAFNGTDAKTFQNTPIPFHINVQKICTDLHLDKKVCNKLPKSVP